MDIEKLIEQLNDFNENHIAVLCGSGQCACGYLCDKDDCIVVRAATALSTLQAENESLKEKLYDGEGVNLVDYWMQQAKIEENGHRNCQAENEKLRAELERVKAERNAAIKDIWVPKWISCKHGESCGFISAVTGMPDCTGCADWEWRGQKED